jgi:hypothetical protein
MFKNVSVNRIADIFGLSKDILETNIYIQLIKTKRLPPKDLSLKKQKPILIK